MSINMDKVLRQQQAHPEMWDFRRKSNSMLDQLPCYEYLCDKRLDIPKELYAYCFRELLQMGTRNVSVEMRLKMFEGVDLQDMMFQDELDAIESFPDRITVYRGTSKKEDIPGLSWSICESKADDFYDGRLFKAEIPKTLIMAYFAHQEDEGEVIAHITSGYEIIDS